LTQRTQPARSSSYNKRSNNWGRICRQEISPPRNPTLRLWRRIRHRRLPRHRHQAATPLPRLFSNWPRTCNREISRRRSRTFPPFNRMCRARAADTIITDMGEVRVGPRKIRLLSCSVNWDRRCSLATCRRRSRLTRRCSRTSSNRPQAVGPHRILRRPQAECRRSRSHGRLRTKGTGYPAWIGKSTGACTRASGLIPVQLTSIQVCFCHSRVPQKICRRMVRYVLGF